MQLIWFYWDASLVKLHDLDLKACSQFDKGQQLLLTPPLSFSFCWLISKCFKFEILNISISFVVDHKRFLQLYGQVWFGLGQYCTLIILSYYLEAQKKDHGVWSWHIAFFHIAGGEGPKIMERERQWLHGGRWWEKHDEEQTTFAETRLETGFALEFSIDTIVCKFMVLFHTTHGHLVKQWEKRLDRHT